MYCRLDDVDFVFSSSSSFLYFPWALWVFSYSIIIHATGGWLQKWKSNPTSDTHICEQSSVSVHHIYPAYIPTPVHWETSHSLSRWTSWKIIQRFVHTWEPNNTNAASHSTAYLCCCRRCSVRIATENMNSTTENSWNSFCSAKICFFGRILLFFCFFFISLAFCDLISCECAIVALAELWPRRYTKRNAIHCHITYIIQC